MKTQWLSSGCEICRQGILSGQSPPKQISVAKGPAFLYYCSNCDSYWLENWREAHVISEQEARSKFPDAFDDKHDLDVGSHE